MMSGSSNAPLDPATESLPSSSLPDPRLGSISSPKKASSEITKIYNAATTLFLTRRLPEAFASIEPLITVPEAEEIDANAEPIARRAPIARASRSSRIKVWSFYITLLDAIADLDLEEGKTAFGSKSWKKLIAKARDGTIWEEVVTVGYEGRESNVDAEVVIDLATLLLSRSATQVTNQSRLESYLSASQNLDIDLTQSLESSNSLDGNNNGKFARNNRANTPRDLNACIKILELFCLHVLPKNGEWDYARAFIENSEILDDETREVFLQDLYSLEHEGSDGQDQHQDAMFHKDDLVEQEPRPAQDVDRQSTGIMQSQPPKSHIRSNSETDYGIDNTLSPIRESKSNNKTAKALPPKPARSNLAKSNLNSLNRNTPSRTIALMSTLRSLIMRLRQQASQNPISLLRFLLFLIGVIVTFSRRDVKDRIRELTGAGWDKVKKTIGMGVKVSYI